MTAAIVISLLVISYLLIGNGFGKWYAREAEKRVIEDRMSRQTTNQDEIYRREKEYRKFVITARVVMTILWIPLVFFETVSDVAILRMAF
jgi:hypothetical protein